jgi:hypothetical protein
MLNIPNSDDNIVLTPFTPLKTVSISISDYISRILNYAYCSESAYIISLIYLDRLLNMYGRSYYNHRSFHRFYITSILIATKYIDDYYLSNKYYARIAGVPVRELNLLESKFLSYIQYDLYVSDEEFNKYLEMISL